MTSTPTAQQSPSNRWRSAKARPLRRGWYQVKLADGSIDWRAWGRGYWWKQIKGGWIAWFSGDGEPRDFQWRGPRKDVALDYSEVASPTAQQREERE